MKKILFVSASNRKTQGVFMDTPVMHQGSINTLLVKAAMKEAEAQGAVSEFVDLTQYPLPLFSEDIELADGVPELVNALKQKFQAADGLFISTPEYNSSYSPLLKNTIDWLSRPTQDNEPRLSAFMDKGAAISAASIGALGGIRALVPLRLLLANIGVNVVGQQLAVAGAHKAFDASGALTDDGYKRKIKNIVNTLIRIS